MVSRQESASGSGGGPTAGGTWGCGWQVRASRRWHPARWAAWLLVLTVSLVLARVCRAGESAAERRQRIANMTPAQKSQLQRRQERFAALKPDEQERIRQLHRQLEDDPNAEQLQAVLHAYYEWLKSLPDEVQSELRYMEPAERLERIRQLRAQEARYPKDEDMKGLYLWLSEYSADPGHQEEILQAAPEQERARFFTRTTDERDWVVARIVWEQFRPRNSAWHGWPGRSERPDWLTDDVLADLREHLSEGTRKRLAKMAADRQWDEIRGWFERLTMRGFSAPSFRDRPPPEELLEQLDQFFEKLSAEEKDRLLNLPTADEMRQELERMYIAQFWPMPGTRGDGRRGGPPGGRVGPSDGRGGRHDGLRGGDSAAGRDRSQRGRDRGNGEQPGSE